MSAPNLRAGRSERFPLLPWGRPQMLQRLALVAGNPQEERNSGSGDHLEQPADESRLAPDVSASDVTNLSFPDHRHRLVARQRSSRRPETAKAKPWLDQPFHIPMSLLDDVVQVFHLSQSRSAPQLASLLHLRRGFWIGRILVHRDGARVHRVWLRQGLAEEPLRRLGIALGREQEVNGLAAAVD